MITALFTLGMGIATALTAGLVATIQYPTLHLWPTPGEKTWQSYVFWPLFRGLNAVCIVMAALSAVSFDLGVPLALRALALLVLAGSVATFIYAFRVLGRDNSYGAQDGLVTAGIYQFSRNPQNAMLIILYTALGIASDHLPTMVLTAFMVGVYTLMVFAEEQWLHGIYGDAYTRYCAEVPRFFGVRRALEHWRTAR